MTSKNKKKILFLITKSSWGGATNYVFDLASSLNPDHFDVVVAFGGDGRLKEELEKKNVRMVSLKALQRDVSILKEFKALLELWRLLRRERPDIFHINSSKAGGLGALIGRLLHVPHIIFTAHGWAFNEERPLWQRIIIRGLHWMTVLLSHTTIAVSEETKKQLHLPFGNQKMVVIHNGRTVHALYERTAAREFIIKQVPELSAFSNEFWSVTIAELHPIKQHDVTIRALAQVIQKHPYTRHIIIGEGEERRKLEALVADLGLQNNVFLTGNIPEAAQYLKAFDLFILSSRSEALAYVLIEACIAGLPIIASNVGGIPEIIQNEKEGVLIPQGDVTALTEQYVRLYTDESFRKSCAKNAEIRASAFTFEKALKKTVALYQ